MIATRSDEASTPTIGGDAFRTELTRESQVWLIGVERHLRGATGGGDPSHHHGGDLQRPR
jgi:hypothetical protein